SPTLIVIWRRKKPLRSRSAGNFAPPARFAVGGGPPATTVFVFAPAAGAAHRAPSIAIASTFTHRRMDILMPPPVVWPTLTPRFRRMQCALVLRSPTCEGLGHDARRRDRRGAGPAAVRLDRPPVPGRRARSAARASARRALRRRRADGVGRPVSRGRDGRARLLAALRARLRRRRVARPRRRAAGLAASGSARGSAEGGLGRRGHAASGWGWRARAQRPRRRAHRRAVP